MGSRDRDRENSAQSIASNNQLQAPSSSNK